MHANNLQELLVYQKALAASALISSLIQRPSFNRDFKLREQLGSSAERCVSSISEGFEQSTDRFFAQYCYRAKGSASEIRTQLIIAVQRSHLTDAERLPLDRAYEEVSKMLNGLIGHLETENRKQRRSPGRRPAPKPQHSRTKAPLRQTPRRPTHRTRTD